MSIKVSQCHKSLFHLALYKVRILLPLLPSIKPPIESCYSFQTVQLELTLACNIETL